MTQIKEFEDRLTGLHGYVRFRATEADMQRIYESNPIPNEPDIPGTYLQQYMSHIFPEIMRRFDFCPQSKCERVCAVVKPAPTAAEPSDGLATLFIAGLDQCRICGDERQTCLWWHSERKSIAADSKFFDHQIEVGNKYELGCLEPLDFFPSPGDRTSRETRLRLAIEIEQVQLALNNADWLRFEIRPLIVAKSFWRSLDSAEFGELGARYRARIINTLLQIATGRCTTCNMHRMVSQTFVHDDVTYNRWNAYVFQSGASDQDRRCSRIYYGTSSAGVVLETYDEDAH